MALKNYKLREPSVVILADGRDPAVSWQNHLNRTGGARGGVDVVAAIGTPVYARTSGTMRQMPNNGSAGNSCQFFHDDNPGWRDVFSHLSGYVGRNGRHFDAGDIVAYTGNTGGVAQHLHWHLLDPKHHRRNPWDYFTPEAAVAGGTTTPLGENDMQLSDLVEVDDGRGGKQKVYYGTLLNHFFVHVTKAANEAAGANAGSRDQPFRSTAMVGTDGSPALVTMGILADHSRVILGAVDAKLTALTAAVGALATAAGASPEAIEAIVKEAVTEALDGAKFDVTLNTAP